MSDYVNILQTTTTGFTPYFTSGYVFSTGAIANGGAWYDGYNASGLHSSGGFLVGISEDSSKLKSFLETADLGSITFSDLDYADTGKFIIGTSDLRGTGIHYSGFGAAAGSAPLTASTAYHFAAYQEITGAAGLSTVVTGKIGIGNDFAQGFYEGTVTTDDLEIDIETTFDTGSQSGSGIRFGRDLSLSMNFIDRAGDSVGSASEFAGNPYFSNLNIDIGSAPNPTVNIVRSGYKENFQDPLFEFSEVDNINVFGSFTKDYTVRTRLTDENGEISTGDFVVYGSPTPKIVSSLVQDASGTFRNNNSSNFVSPTPDAPNSQDLTSHSQINTTPLTGGIYVEVDFPYGQRLDLDRIDIYGASGQGNSFPLKPANFLRSHDLSDGFNTFTITRNFGVTQEVPYFYALVPYSVDGTSGTPQSIGPFTAAAQNLARDPILYKNVTNQKMKGCLDIQGCGLNIVGDGSAGATPPTLYVSGDSSGTGEGSRLTLNNIPYMLSGDAAASTGITLQGVTDNGNATTNDISVGSTGAPTAPVTIKTDPSDHAGLDVYADGDLGNRILTLKADSSAAGEIIVKDTAGVDSVKLSNTSSRGQLGLFDAGGNLRGEMVVDSNNQGELTLKDSSANASIKLSSDSNKRGIVDIYDAAGVSKIEMKADSNDEGIMSIKDSLGNLSTKVQGHKSVISALNSNIYSTGSVIIAGSGHIISGDFDLIAGGATANISGGDYNFIGGGSGIDITHSAYSSSIGGYNNDIGSGDYSVIAGGKNNLISGLTASHGRNFIGGGQGNHITGVPISCIVGGDSNKIYGFNSTIVGGNDNRILANGYSFVGGGESNYLLGEFANVLGGEGNATFGTHANIAGGGFNVASGIYSFVGGGLENKASGDYSYAFGRKVEIGKDQDGAAVLADGQDRTHSSSGQHTLTLDFASGVYVPTTGFFNALHVSGVPVLTGENNPAEADTLQTVTNRGDTTTNSIEIEGQHLSGVTGKFSRDLDVGTDPSHGGHVLSASSTNGRVGVGMNGSDVGGGAFAVYGGAMIGSSYAPYEAPPSDGLLVQGTAGFGTSSPASGAVHIYKNATIGTITAPNVANATLHIQDSSTNMYLDGNSIVTDDNSYISTSGSNYLAFGTNNTERIRIEGGGDIGIGTTNPSYCLEVTKSAASSLLSRFYNSSSTNGQGILVRAGETSNENRILQLASRDDTKVMTVNSNGRVGIGADTTPTYNLDLGGGTSSTSNTLRINQNDGGTAIRMGAGGGSSDVVMLRIDGSSTAGEHDGETDKSKYGFSLKYMGARSSNANSLSVFSDNQAAANQVEALTITQSGQLGILSTGISNFSSDIMGLQVAPNTDVSAEIGRAHVGSVGHTDYAGFSHVDQNTTTNYAILQQSNGATYVNAANGTNIYFRMNNAAVGGFNSSTDFYVDTDTLYVDASEDRVGINTTTPANALDVVGHFSATSKSFVIDHPTKENKKLQYGSLEGPEHGVFVRGTTNKNVIKLPDYWKDLVHEDSITVTLTPLHTFQSLYVKSKTPEQIVVGGVERSYDYVVYGERKDIDKLEVEI